MGINSSVDSYSEPQRTDCTAVVLVSNNDPKWNTFIHAKTKREFKLTALSLTSHYRLDRSGKSLVTAVADTKK